MKAFINVIQYNKVLKFFLIILFFFSASCANFTNMKSQYINEGVSLSVEQQQRFSNYLLGEYYSFEIKRNVIGYPIAFAISEDGKKSIIIACASYFSECNHTVQLYQQMEKYRKKTNLNFKILALEKKIVINNPSLKSLLTSKKKFKPVDKSSNTKFYDYLIVPADSCAGDDC